MEFDRVEIVVWNTDQEDIDPILRQLEDIGLTYEIKLTRKR